MNVKRLIRRLMPVLLLLFVLLLAGPSIIHVSLFGRHDVQPVSVQVFRHFLLNSVIPLVIPVRVFHAPDIIIPFHTFPLSFLVFASHITASCGSRYFVSAR